MEKLKNKQTKIIFIVVSILLIMPSIIYMIQNKTLLGFNKYYNFFITDKISKTISTYIYLCLLGLMIISYYKLIQNKKEFKNIKEFLKYVIIISCIFLFIIPWTSSDIFYYMGVGELDSVYGQNPYYVTIRKFSKENEKNLKNDSILKQGNTNVWANTTVVYGPIAQLIFKICATLSFKNINVCWLIFKLINLLVHITNCYLIYKLTGKLKFSIIYGLNPFVLLEFLGMLHNDIIVVFFVLLTLYFLTKKKNIYFSLICLALATGIKYFTVLLLPIVIFYYIGEEEKISIKILKCIKYGIIFFVIIGIEYIPYFENIEVILAMISQTTRYAKSIYSAMLIINKDFMEIVRAAMMTLFVYCFVLKCFKFLFNKNNSIMKMLRKYNTTLILFLLILTNCQQWYIVWLFATIMWQKPKMIKNIIWVSLITEFANSIYMFKREIYIYDLYYVAIIIIMLLLAQGYAHIKADEDRSNQIGKTSVN